MNKNQSRDLSQAQFDSECARLGFTPEGFMGYYRLPIPNRHCCVSIYNAGSRRRAQLAYLIQERDKRLANPH